eukprot:7275-Heterococcus_DN1.PRE.1
MLWYRQKLPKYKCSAMAIPSQSTKVIARASSSTSTSAIVELAIAVVLVLACHIPHQHDLQLLFCACELPWPLRLSGCTLYVPRHPLLVLHLALCEVPKHKHVTTRTAWLGNAHCIVNSCAVTSLQSAAAAVAVAGSYHSSMYSNSAQKAAQMIGRPFQACKRALRWQYIAARCPRYDLY